MDYIRKYDYAAQKGVSRAYISKLVKRGKLRTDYVLGMEVVIDCQENDDLFGKPAYNRGKIR